jgi:hypothetical protein
MFALGMLCWLWHCHGAVDGVLQLLSLYMHVLVEGCVCFVGQLNGARWARCLRVGLC